MSLRRPKSPHMAHNVKSAEKEESFWEKFSTIGRKKGTKEVQKVEEEGKHAIESPGLPNQFDIPPEDYTLRDLEQRAVIDPQSLNNPEVIKLQRILIDWLNDELAEQRIIVQSIEEDLYDGQVLHKLWEKLTGKKLDVLEVTQSEEGQRQKLDFVLNAVNHTLGFHQKIPKWSVESVHSKNLVAILHLLVALARYFRAPIRLPENVFVYVVIAQKSGGVLNAQKFREQITSEYDDVGMRCDKDAFDTLFDCAPEKLSVVKKSLITFVNKHLTKLNFEITDLNSDFRDGVYLCLLMGLLGGFFVPLYEFHLTPQDIDQMVSNVAFSFDLMQDAGLPKPKARPEDIVNMDLKSTLRVLYNLFTTYRSVA
ncbi:beta-parvin isoform X1 [Bactrocera dorsalis]|uniref:Alpha-parvin n=2 Tax=Endopterygota TaxID=33392 RepID=A0A034WRQ2_BACDO|nr:beta-parvin isoform X1 [Bactrocera dorsalis]